MVNPFFGGHVGSSLEKIGCVFFSLCDMQLAANVSETTNLIPCLGWEEGSDRTEEREMTMCVIQNTWVSCMF